LNLLLRFFLHALKLAPKSDSYNKLRKLSGFKPFKRRRAIVGSALLDLALYILLDGKAKA
jgi:hypothetical protein